MELLALALAPGIAIIWFIYLRDKYDKEPFKALVKSFLLGMAVTLPAIILQWAGFSLLNHLMPATGWTYYIIFAFPVVYYPRRIFHCQCYSCRSDRGKNIFT